MQLETARETGRLGLPFEGHLDPAEQALAATVMAGLAPSDLQEEMQAWHLAVTHILAAQRIGKSRAPDLSARGQQIEIGLAVRLLNVNERKSTALDRHRALKQKAERELEKSAREAEKAAEKAAAREGAARPEEAEQPSFLVTPEAISPEEWSRQAIPQQRRLMNGEAEPAGHPEARDRIWRERCAYVIAEAIARSESGGILRAPYPTDEEVAARADADRRAKQPAAGKGPGGPMDAMTENTAAEDTAAWSGPDPPAK